MAGEWNHTSGKWNGDAEDKGECTIPLNTLERKIGDFSLLCTELCFLLQVSRPLRTTGSMPFRR